MPTKCTGMRSTKSHVEAVGKHLQLEAQPCTNVSCNFASKPMTGTAGDPVTNCMISVSSIPGTPENKIKKSSLSLFSYRNKYVTSRYSVYICIYSKWRQLWLHKTEPFLCCLSSTGQWTCFPCNMLCEIYIIMLLAQNIKSLNYSWVHLPPWATIPT